MIIEIKALTFECIIGILDFERTTPQKVIIDCQIDYTYTQDFLNYALVAQTIENRMIDTQFELIETALLELNGKLKAEFPAIESLTLKISKPDILPNCEVSLQETFKY